MSYTRLTRDFYQAVESLMEGKLEPTASEGGGSHPKTDKHKKLAAMGHPKDEITQKDVLIARGVVAKEEAGQLDETDDDLKLAVAIERSKRSNSARDEKKTAQNVARLKPEQYADYLRGGPKPKPKPKNEAVKPELEKHFPASGVRKHPPYKNPGLEKLAARKEKGFGPSPADKLSIRKGMKEDAEELEEGRTDNMKAADVYQMDLVDHIKKKTGHKVYFDGDDMVHEKTGKTIMTTKPHHTIGHLISAVNNHVAASKKLGEEVEELQENISNNHKVGDVYQMDLVDHIKKKTGTKVYFDGDDMVHEKTGKTIMNVKAHHTVGDAISAVKKVGKGVTEEFEEEVDQIITENNSFEIEVPAQLTYKDYLDAAMKFVDADDALTVAEAFYNEQDESLVIEAFTRSDIEQKVKVHQKAGNQVSMPKFGTKDGKPYAEYVVTNKDDGIRRKYIHHGTMRRVENMGAKGKKDAD